MAPSKIKKEFFLYENPDLAYRSRKKEYLPLWAAMTFQQEVVVGVLLGLGADPDQKSPKEIKRFGGCSFLEIAANIPDYLVQDYAIAEMLIHHGADVNAYCKSDQKTLLQVAIMNGSTLCADLLLKNGVRLQGPEWLKFSPVEFAFFINNDTVCNEMVSLLIKHGVNVKYRDDAGHNLLHNLIAFFAKNKIGNHNIFEIVKTMVEAGVPVDEPNNEGLTPLHLAIYRNDLKLINYLLSKGADVNKKCKDELSSLYQATEYGYPKLVELFLDHGAEINAGNDEGLTSLHIACLSNNETIIKILLQRGADISSMSKLNETPFSLLGLKKSEFTLSITAMVKEFAKVFFENIQVCKSDLDLIRSHPKVRKIFENCKKELFQMSSTKIYGSYSYYSILKMSVSVKKLANLAKNEEFVKSFQDNLSFNYYKADLQLIFEKAIQVRDNSLVVFSRLNSIFGDFLPEVVIRILTTNLETEDLPLEDSL